MKRIYDEIDDLLKDMQSDINNVLIEEVTDEVRDIMIEHIQEDVYDAYTPKIYERRKRNGLDDPDNIVGTLERDGLLVENVAEFNDGYGTYNRGFGLAELVNDGEGKYYYDYPGEFEQARPFLDNTAKEVEQGKRVDNAFDKGMTKRGWDIQ